jgi:hypothetical protein
MGGIDKARDGWAWPSQINAPKEVGYLKKGWGDVVG